MKYYVQFRNFIIDSMDYYYKHTIKHFINYFVNKYESKMNIINTIDNIDNINIVEALQIESIKLFIDMMNLCKTDTDYIIKYINLDNHKLLERKDIMDYLYYNQIYI